MLKLLIVAATPFEILPLLKHAGIDVTGEGLYHAGRLYVLITGVGMVNMAYHLGRCNTDFDLVLNAGVGGAFDRDLQLGDVVQVTEDMISEMGAEDDQDFIHYDDMKLGGTNIYKERIITPIAAFSHLKKVSGITVNTVHGNEASIQTALARYKSDVESMEGAAFFRGCAHFTGQVIQLRAISNYVEKRDKSKWNMPLAIKNLNDILIQLINDL